MAQTPNPYGFKLIYAKESNLSAGLQTFPIASRYADNIFSGAPVRLSINGLVKADKSPTDTATHKIVTPIRNPIVGIFGGCSFIPSGTGNQFKRSPNWVATTPTKDDQPALATVNDHSFMIWQVQTNGKFSANAYTAGTNTPIGLNYDFTYPVAGDGNVDTGQSRAQLNVLTNAIVNGNGLPAHTGTDSSSDVQIQDAINASTDGLYAPFKIIGLAPIPNNNWGDDFVDVYVVINNHYLKLGTDGRAATA